MNDLALPSNVEAERAVLGAILFDNAMWAQAAEVLKADDFSLNSHRSIWLRMMELADASHAIDYVTLTEQLQQHKDLETVGGVTYVTSLTDGLPRVKNIQQYIRIVRDKSLLRMLIHATNSIQASAYEQCQSAQEIIADAEGQIFAIAEKKIGDGFSTPGQILKDSFVSIDALYARGQRITGLQTYYEDYDDLTSGLQKPDLIIIAARPSMGKTAFAINIAENAAILGTKIVAVFSLEMSKESLLIRMLCSQARVNAHKLRTGFLGKEDYQKLVTAVANLIEAPIFIDDTPAISLTEMRAKCRRLLQAQGRIDLVVVDYLQLMTPPALRRNSNRTEEVSAISRGLKGLAKELDCPMVALSQLSRAPEGRSDPRPQLSDLRESGGIEQDADVVTFIFREELYKPEDPDLFGIAELITAKQRNGPIGTVKLAFLKACTRFDNLAKELPA